MKTFKQYYTNLKIETVINEQLASNASEDVIIENISNFIVNEMGTPMMTDPGMVFRGGLEKGFDSTVVPDALSTAGVFPEGGLIGLIPDMLSIFKWIGGAGLSIVAIKVVARMLEKMIKKSNAISDKAAAIADVEGETEFNSKVRDAIDRGDALTDDEKHQLANDISGKLSEKYPSRDKKWWLKVLNQIVKFLKGKGGIGLALLGYILI